MLTWWSDSDTCILSSTVFATVLWLNQMLQHGMRYSGLQLHHGVDEEWSSTFASLLKSTECQISTFTMTLIYADVGCRVNSVVNC